MDAALPLTPEPALAPTRATLPSDLPVVQLRHRGVTLDRLPALFDAGYAVLARLGPIGPGFAIYDGEVTATFDLTIGFPVAGPPQAVPADVEYASFPAGEALLLSHLGPYDTLPAAWDRLATAAAEQDLRITRAVEVYVSDPTATAPADLRTDLVAILG